MSNLTASVTSTTDKDSHEPEQISAPHASLGFPAPKSLSQALQNVAHAQRPQNEAAGSTPNISSLGSTPSTAPGSPRM